LDISMTDEQLKAILSDYITNLDARVGTQAGEARLAAHESMFQMASNAPNDLWRLLEIAWDSELGDRELGMLAAGALEDLLGHHGEDFMEKLEIAARQNSKARFMVAGVWRGGMSNAVWERFLLLREPFGIKPL